MFKKGEAVGLAGEAGREYVINLSGEMTDVGHIGMVDTSRLMGLKSGDAVNINERDYILFKPKLSDLLSVIKRKAQIIMLKDAAVIISRTGIKAGDVVVEAGAGSGAMTICLCHAVWPSGKVFTYDIREDFVNIAKENIEKAGFGGISLMKVGDVSKDVLETDVSAFILDVPEPWLAVGAAKKALSPGGAIAVYVPTVNQAERTVRELRDNRFRSILCTETIERELEIGPGGARPSFTSPGHTGYIITARRMGD